MSAANSILKSLGTKILTHAIILYQGIIIARMLGPEGKGLQAQIVVLASLFIFIFDLGLANALGYKLGHRQINTSQVKKYLQQTFILQISLAAVLFLFLNFLVQKDLFLFKSNEVIFYLFYLAISVFFENRFQMIYSLLSSQFKFEKINRIDILSATLKFLLYSSLFFLNPSVANLGVIFLIDIVVNIICLLLAKLSLRDFFNENTQVSTEETLANFWKPILVYSLPLAISNVVYYFNTRLDYWIIQKHLGLESLGYYSVASSGVQLLTIVPIAIGGILLSHMNSMPYEKKAVFFLSYCRLNFTLLVFVILFAIPLSPFFISLLFGSAYNNSIHLFQWLLVVCLFHSHKYILGLLLQTVGKSQLRFKSDLIVFVLNICFISSIVKEFGLVGAIAFNLILQFIAIIAITYFLKKSKISLAQCFVLTKSDVYSIFKRPSET
jgi:O-antigen/teichoic acid export membrane protein